MRWKNPHFKECNIKFAFKFPAIELKKIEKWKTNGTDITKPSQLLKISHNGIFTFRINKYYYNIFPSSGVVNVTGVKSMKKIEHAIQEIVNFFQLNVPEGDFSRLHSISIHNCTAKGKFDKIINLTKLGDENRELTGIPITIMYDPYRFPGIRLKHSSFGYMLLYSSGHFLLTGCKSEDELSSLYNHCHYYLNIHNCL